MNLRVYFSLWISKLVLIILKLLGRKGSFFAGKVAVFLFPNYLAKVNKCEHIICVTGTNGKTTTTNLIADSLEKLGIHITSNRLGANIDSGIATALSNNLNWLGKIKNNYMVLEVDERFSRLILPKINPEYLIVTNLTRDTLRRNAHSDYIFSVIDTYTPKTTKLILNADDLCSSRLCQNNQRIFYGIDKQKNDVKTCKNIINDYKLCPLCNSKLEYNYVRYHHIGNAYCPNCDFKSYEADSRILTIGDKEIIVLYKNIKYKFSKINDAIFNIYNELALITLLFDMGFSYEQVNKTISEIKIVDTRYNLTKVGKTSVKKVMAKGQNSVACCQVLDYIMKEKGTKTIIFDLDDYFDRYHNQEFEGWIYDVDFEFIDDSVKQIIAIGARCYDFVVRLQLAGIKKDIIIAETTEAKALKKLNLDVDSIYILIDTTTIDIGAKVEAKVIEMLRRKYED